MIHWTIPQHNRMLILGRCYLCVNSCSIDHDIWSWVYRSLNKPTIQPNHQLKLFCNTQTYRLQYIPDRIQRHLKLTLWHIFKTSLNREQTYCLFIKPFKFSTKYRLWKHEICFTNHHAGTSYFQEPYKDSSHCNFLKVQTTWTIDGQIRCSNLTGMMGRTPV